MNMHVHLYSIGSTTKTALKRNWVNIAPAGERLLNTHSPSTPYMSHNSSIWVGHQHPVPVGGAKLSHPCRGVKLPCLPVHNKPPSAPDKGC